MSVVRHEVTAVPVEKMGDDCIRYRFRCSCGREGNGWHRTPEQAIRSGRGHISVAVDAGVSAVFARYQGDTWREQALRDVVATIVGGGPGVTDDGGS